LDRPDRRGWVVIRGTAEQDATAITQNFMNGMIVLRKYCAEMKREMSRDPLNESSHCRVTAYRHCLSGISISKKQNNENMREIRHPIVEIC
jgi:hypothetical protein